MKKTMRTAYRWTRKPPNYNVVCVECDAPILEHYFQKEYTPIENLRSNTPWGLVKNQTLCRECYKDLYGPDKQNE